VLLDYLEYSDLNESCRWLADAIGIESMKVILSKLAPITIDIPNPSNLSELRERFIIANHRSMSVHRMAKELNRSEKTIRRTLRQLREEGLINQEAKYINLGFVKPKDIKTNYQSLLEDSFNYD